MIRKLSDQERQASKDLCDCKKPPVYEFADHISGVGTDRGVLCEKCYKQWKRFQSQEKDTTGTRGNFEGPRTSWG